LNLLRSPFLLMTSVLKFTIPTLYYLQIILKHITKYSVEDCTFLRYDTELLQTRHNENCMEMNVHKTKIIYLFQNVCFMITVFVIYFNSACE
jgi:predicted HAD superfamily hydrolase